MHFPQRARLLIATLASGVEGTVSAHPERSSALAPNLLIVLLAGLPTLPGAAVTFASSVVALDGIALAGLRVRAGIARRSPGRGGRA